MPYRRCRWCKDKRSTMARIARLGGSRCRRCHESKLTRRFGAYHVHKVKLSLLQAWDERKWFR